MDSKQIKHATPIIIPPKKPTIWYPQQFVGSKKGIALFCDDILHRETQRLSPTLTDWIQNPNKEHTLPTFDILKSYRDTLKHYNHKEVVSCETLISIMIEDFNAPFWYIKNKSTHIHADPFKTWKR